MSRAIGLRQRWWKDPAWSGLGIAATFLASAYAASIGVRPAATDGRATDTIMLTVPEVETLGGGTAPTWKQIGNAYGLTNAQLRRSACLTHDRPLDCDTDLTRQGSDFAKPVRGRLLLYLPNRH